MTIWYYSMDDDDDEENHDEWLVVFLRSDPDLESKQKQLADPPGPDWFPQDVKEYTARSLDHMISCGSHEFQSGSCHWRPEAMAHAEANNHFNLMDRLVRSLDDRFF